MKVHGKPPNQKIPDMMLFQGLEQIEIKQLKSPTRWFPRYEYVRFVPLN